MPLDIDPAYDPQSARADTGRALRTSGRLDHDAVLPPDVLADVLIDLYGPRLARPSWVRLVPPGTALPTDEAPSRVHARSRALAASRIRSQQVRREAWVRLQALVRSA